MAETNTPAVVITDQAFNALMLVAEEGMSKEQAAYSLQLAPWEVNYHIKQTLYLIDQARRNGFRVMRTRTQPSQATLPLADINSKKEVSHGRTSRSDNSRATDSIINTKRKTLPRMSS